VDGHLGGAREWGFLDQLIAGHTVRARLMHASGALPAAHATLDAGMAIAQECGLERLALQMTAERVRLYLRSGSPTTGRGSSGGQRQAPVSQEARGFGGITGLWLNYLPGVARSDLGASGPDSRSHLRCVPRLAPVAQLLHATSRGAISDPVGIVAGGGTRRPREEQAAHRALRDALAVGASSGFTRSFLDEGPSIEQMLRDMYGDAGGGTDRHPTDSFGCAILLAFDMARGPSRNAAPGRPRHRRP